MKHNWIVRGTSNGFEFKVLLWGTEDEIRDYMKSELDPILKDIYYSGATDEEVRAAKKLGMKIYLV